MIFLGLDSQEKDQRIGAYCSSNGIQKVVILSPSKFRFPCSFPATEYIEYAEIIEYRFFYRLLQEIGPQTLLVVNECMRTQNRYDLTYNCIRNFLNQTPHQLIFQFLPLIDTIEDFMVLFDFDTRSRWKREKFNADLMKESRIEMKPVDMRLHPIHISTDEKLKAAYQKEKERLIKNIGLKDPHTIPRNLYLMSGKAKMQHVDASSSYIGRNNRFKIDAMQTYKEAVYPNAPYTVFEFCHNFIDLSDLLALSRQSEFDVLSTDLKIDQWYLTRYQDWRERIQHAQTSIQRDRCVECGA